MNITARDLPEEACSFFTFLKIYIFITSIRYSIEIQLTLQSTDFLFLNSTIQFHIFFKG